MKLSDSIKLVSQLIDLPIIDKDGRWCGIVDDVELTGTAGKPMRIKALLVGPGAYRGRLPAWAFWLTRCIAGDRITRVPAKEVAAVGSVVRLQSTADKLGLGRVDAQLSAWIPRGGAF